MRYLGSKVKLLEFIHRTIIKYNIIGNSFCDLFAGTASVSDYFKGQYEIIANDFMYYSYVFSKAKLFNNTKPSFDRFVREYNRDIFEWLNSQTYTPNEDYFIYYNYSPKGNRFFFTEYNAIKIDGVRFAIENLNERNLLTENEYFFLKASLLDCVTRYSNTSGTYEAFFKFWESRALKEFTIEPIEIVYSHNLKQNFVYNQKSNDLIRSISGDILYLDPPYTVTQYASAYNILETIARNDKPAIKGVAGKRDKGKCVSNYCYARKAKEEFEDLFRQSQFKHILMSYSNQGVVPLDEMVDLARLFAKDGVVYVEDVEYQEYQNHRSSNKRNGDKLKEVLIYFEKDLSIIKSPLNYAGSKDKMYFSIQKYFPKHIDTFVDVMGGAFNMGINVVSTNQVVYNDINPYVYHIVEWLLSPNKEHLIQDVENCIQRFGLCKANETPYLALREYYNSNERSPLNLFVLHMYSFQNYIRFNSKQRFNTPIGVAGYSDDLKNRILKFYPRTSNVVLSNIDYRDIDYLSYPEGTLFYFDPPYLITKAAYNDGKRGFDGWSNEHEISLYQILSNLNSHNYNFILSNVKEHKGKINTQLINWAHSNNFKIIEMGLSGWRYAKNEIIITNIK